MEKLKKNEILVLRRNIYSNKSHNGFKYPKEIGAIVEAPDWIDSEQCGNGLHGWTQGAEDYFDTGLKGYFYIIKVNKEDGFVDLGDKIKFRKGEIIYYGEAGGAHQIMLNYYPDMRLHWSTSNQGDKSTSNQGDSSTSNQGDKSTSNQRDSSTSNQGDMSTSNQGDKSTSNQGDMSTSNQGDMSVAVFYGGDAIYRGTNGCMVQFYDGEMQIFKAEKSVTFKIVRGEIEKKYKTTPDNIQNLEDYEIFVFGSNMNGNHSAGAAKTAKEEFGAEEGVAEGITGSCYAFPTLSKNMQKVTEDGFKKSIQKLIDCANAHTSQIFFVTKIGCGIAGFQENQVKEYFAEFRNKLSANIILPWIL